MAASLLVICCSLSPSSRSRVLGGHVYERLTAMGAAAAIVDLASLGLPLCDGEGSCDHPHVRDLRDRIRAADGVLLAFPVYNYDAGAATKNLIELTGDAWEGKIVAMACAAGGTASYMAPMALAQSLMLDFRCMIIPRFVFTTGAAFTDGQLTDPDIHARLDALAAELLRVTSALKA